MIIINVFLIYSCFLIQLSFQESKTFIIVDAGSSSTKFNGFIFEYKNNKYVLKSSLYKHGTALSEFTSEKQDWSVLRALFTNKTNELLIYLGKPDRSKIQIIVRATAGLRALDVSVSKRIIKKVSDIVKDLGFKTKLNSVSLMSGEDEAKYGWIAVNFLKGAFDDCGMETYGSLDLGGGSTQVAFQSDSSELNDELVTAKVFGIEYEVYTRSYEHKGLNVIRLKYFNYYQHEQDNLAKKPVSNYKYKSSCVNPQVNRQLKYGDLKINITGKRTPSKKSATNCLNLGIKFASEVREIRSLIRPFDMPFVAMSAFYYILRDLNLDEDQNLILQKLIESQKKYCTDMPYASKSQPFKHLLCMDLSYVRALLIDKYGFTSHDKLSVRKKINGVALSWALGLAVEQL